MGLLDDAIREHLELKRRRGADPTEIERAEREALGPVRRGPDDLAGEGTPEPLAAEASSDAPLDHGELEWEHEPPEEERSSGVRRAPAYDDELEEPYAADAPDAFLDEQEPYADAPPARLDEERPYAPPGSAADEFAPTVPPASSELPAS